MQIDFTDSSLCCSGMSELHQSILWNYLSISQTKLWRSKKQKDLPLALKDGLQDRVSQEAIRFNGTASSLWPPGSSSQLDLTDKNVVCGYIRKGHIGISIWSLTLCDPPSHSDPIQQWEQLRWENIISSCAQLASNMWHLPLFIQVSTMWSQHEQHEEVVEEHICIKHLLSSLAKIFIPSGFNC